jgi:hypothetical protein
MNRTSHRIAMAAALLLAGLSTSGCAQTKHAAPTTSPQECNPGNCRITVTVNDCQAEGGIIINPDFVLVTSARNMRWEIVTPGFEFKANGIQFDPPNAQFEPRNSPQPNEVHIHNNKTQAGDFYYYVNVKKTGGADCRPVDPFVRNTN